MAGEPTWTEKGEASAQAATNFVEHFHEHRIWLDQDLCADIQTVNDRLYEAYVDYTTYHHDDPNVQKERLEAWMWAWKHVRDRPGASGKDRGAYPRPFRRHPSCRHLSRRSPGREPEGTFAYFSEVT